MTTERKLEADKLWAQHRLNEEWARTEEEPHLKFMARINHAEIQRELSRLFRKPRTAPAHEL